MIDVTFMEQKLMFDEPSKMKNGVAFKLKGQTDLQAKFQLYIASTIHSYLLTQFWVPY